VSLRDRESHFAFGKNWLDYASKIDESRIRQAMDDLSRLGGGRALTGAAFLDIGCGSGLHSLAALRLGAARVVGLDIDEDSVAAATATIARFAPAAPARFAVRSVFELRPEELGCFDVVYSWGVLHHTGDMVAAIESAARLVSPGGAFYLALYRKTNFCGMWRSVKRWYSRATPQGQGSARRIYESLFRLGCWVRGRSFSAYIADYSRQRGMDFHNDVHDWLGGYPYESISPGACHALLGRLGFEAEREFVQRTHLLSGLLGSGCDEYVFRRVAQPG
jgi:2-polyprenyl-6-hydroxyphenyl methylase/3-demethylubiquinone-9 3-methyltransferase